MTNDAKGTAARAGACRGGGICTGFGRVRLYSGYSLKAGVATESEVVSTMGAPAKALALARWRPG